MRGKPFMLFYQLNFQTKALKWSTDRRNLSSNKPQNKKTAQELAKKVTPYTANPVENTGLL